MALQCESLVGLEIKSAQLRASLQECSPHAHAVPALQSLTLAMEAFLLVITPMAAVQVSRSQLQLCILLCLSFQSGGLP